MFEEDKSAIFTVYRYQILPINRTGFGELLDDKHQVRNLISRKNELFLKVLLNIKRFLTNKTKINHEFTYHDDDFVLLKFAANRHIQVETEDFKKQELDNWPAITIAINNNPDKQLIFVEKRTKAFTYPSTPVKIIQDSVNHGLSKDGLRVHFEPLFEEHEFWKIIEENQIRIKKISFELVTPNMSGISKVLDEELKDLAKETNTATTNLSLEADPSAVLKIDRSNKKISALVNYASNGGGDVTLQLRGVKKRISAQKTIKEVEIESILISGDKITVVNTIKSIMNSL